MSPSIRSTLQEYGDLATTGCRPRTFEKEPIVVLNSQCTLGLDRSGTSACKCHFLPVHVLLTASDLYPPRSIVGVKQGLNYAKKAPPVCRA